MILFYRSIDLVPIFNIYFQPRLEEIWQVCGITRHVKLEGYMLIGNEKVPNDWQEIDLPILSTCLNLLKNKNHQ